LIDVAEILIQDQLAKWQLECRRRRAVHNASEAPV
jgi:hypothetical protein